MLGIILEKEKNKVAVITLVAAAAATKPDSL
jgi:hypothetical protein